VIVLHNNGQVQVTLNAFDELLTHFESLEIVLKFRSLGHLPKSHICVFRSSLERAKQAKDDPKLALD
jgi:hypothetical protein